MTALKASILEVNIPGERKKNVLLTSMGSITKAPIADGGIFYSVLQLGSIWSLIIQTPVSSWLAWTHNDVEFAIHNNDRFRHMIKTQKDMAHHEQGYEIDPVYQLALRNGPLPEDQDEW